jgi:hypothetical protein
VKRVADEGAQKAAEKERRQNREGKQASERRKYCSREKERSMKEQQELFPLLNAFRSFSKNASECSDGCFGVLS